MEKKITYFWKNKPIFGKERLQETLSVCTHTYVCAHTHSNHVYTYLRYTHASRVPETMKGKLFAHKFVWNESHIV